MCFVFCSTKTFIFEWSLMFVYFSNVKLECKIILESLYNNNNICNSIGFTKSRWCRDDGLAKKKEERDILGFYCKYSESNLKIAYELSTLGSMIMSCKSLALLAKCLIRRTECLWSLFAKNSANLEKKEWLVI